LPDRPNVLIVFSDQERYIPLGDAPSRPAQRRLASEGVTFTNAFCTTPQCSAARAALLSGVYPHRCGVVANVDGTSPGSPLPVGTPTLGTMLRDAGYLTCYVGKWHLGRPGPAAHGFDIVFQDDRPGGGAADPNRANQAAAWCLSNPSRPWLCVVSLHNPHDIYRMPPREQRSVRPDAPLPPNVADDLSPKPPPQLEYLHRDCPDYVGAPRDLWREYVSFYYDRIDDVDSCLGTVLTALEQSGRAGDTVVVYTSDHGDLGGAHGLPFKGPCMYEELLRVPLIVRWPGGGGGGRAMDELVSHLDLAPTILRLCGVDAPDGLDGMDLATLVEGRGAAWRDALFFEYEAKQDWFNPLRAVRTEGHKLVEYLDGWSELYDLSADPWEMRNLVGDAEHAGVEGELRARLGRWRRRSADPGPMPRPGFPSG